MAKVLVTGGAGYIGSHTCVELLNSGYEVVVVDNYFNSVPEVINRIEVISGKKLKVYDCDIRNYEGLKKIFSENAIDAVIHFAGLKAVGESCKIPLEYFDNNVSGTVTLCKVMSEFGVKNIVFSSSATVYGNNDIPYVEGMTTGDVSSPYGRTKHIIELILKDLYLFDKQWSISLLRYFNPIGAHESGLIGEDPNGIPNNLMPYISRVAVGKLPFLTIFGDDYNTKDGTCVRDYIHVVDLAKGHIRALDKLMNKSGVHIYNLGKGVGYSVLDIVNAFQKVIGRGIDYRFGPRRAGDLPEFYASVEKAKNDLGWSAQYDIDKMCEDTWRWQSQNPDGFSK